MSATVIGVSDWHVAAAIWAGSPANPFSSPSSIGWSCAWSGLLTCLVIASRCSFGTHLISNGGTEARPWTSLMVGAPSTMPRLARALLAPARAADGSPVGTA